MPAAGCPIPDNEANRLRAVHSFQILDSEPELEFDALTRVASHAFATPIAVVAMMDSERLWFKSRLGLDAPELDRKIAFCAHTIMRPSELLVAEDLRADIRFADNPLVASPPNIRFYAGAAIVDHDDHALGTIAVIDTQPRRFRESQRQTLMDFSALAMTALQSRRRAVALSRLAMTDHLTGIANRARFAAEISAEVQSSKQSGKLGGVEFGIVARNADPSAARVLAEHIRTAVKRSIRLSSGSIACVGISVGIASYTRRVSSIDELLA